MEFHPPLSSPHSPPGAGPWLTLVSPCCAEGPQGLTLTFPLLCSVQEQLPEQTARLCSPAFPGQGPLTSVLHLLTSPFKVLCLFYKLNILFGVTLCQSFYFKIEALVKSGGWGHCSIGTPTGGQVCGGTEWVGKEKLCRFEGPRQARQGCGTLLQFPHWGQASQG